jgi:hypothetical protein
MTLAAQSVHFARESRITLYPSLENLAVWADKRVTRVRLAARPKFLLRVAVMNGKREVPFAFGKLHDQLLEQCRHGYDSVLLQNNG